MDEDLVTVITETNQHKIRATSWHIHDDGKLDITRSNSNGHPASSKTSASDKATVVATFTPGSWQAVMLPDAL